MGCEQTPLQAPVPQPGYSLNRYGHRATGASLKPEEIELDQAPLVHRTSAGIRLRCHSFRARCTTHLAGRAGRLKPPGSTAPPALGSVYFARDRGRVK